jgi:integrase/recombinase XerD
MQEQRRFAPSTVSRRLSVVVGFYRTCVIDGILQHSPADYVRRPTVSPQSPTLGLTHLQFEAMLTAARDSANPNDFALVCLLGLLGLRIFETTSRSLTRFPGHAAKRLYRLPPSSRSCRYECGVAIPRRWPSETLRAWASTDVTMPDLSRS